MPGLFAGNPYELNLETIRAATTALYLHSRTIFWFYLANFTGFETSGTGYIKTPKLQ